MDVVKAIAQSCQAVETRVIIQRQVNQVLCRKSDKSSIMVASDGSFIWSISAKSKVDRVKMARLYVDSEL